MIHRAVELGINYFDTAISYGNGGEPEALRQVPGARCTATRSCWSARSTIAPAQGAKRQLDSALPSLGTDQLDILHFHHIDSIGDVDRIMAKGGAYEVVARAKEQGMIRFIGLSGHSTGAILVDALTRIKPDVMMCPQNAAREAGFTDMVIPLRPAERHRPAGHEGDRPGRADAQRGDAAGAGALLAVAAGLGDDHRHAQHGGARVVRQHRQRLQAADRGRDDACSTAG